MPRGANGALFKNDRKQRSNQPDFTGTITLNKELLEDFLRRMDDKGEYKARIASWEKDGRNGKFLSLMLEAHYERGSGGSSGGGDPPF